MLFLISFLCLAGVSMAGNNVFNYAKEQPAAFAEKTNFLGYTNTETNIDIFAGIPYAKPPVDELRLRVPQPFTFQSGDLQATSFSPACTSPARATEDPAAQRTQEISEDCLTLNVFRPTGTNATSNLAVMVWIYGGGFMGGSSYRYDPATLINTAVGMDEPILFVSLNYRVGILGFANGVEAERAGATNLGLLDQELAVQWVIQNIKAFGGDPTKVTLSGQSAGSVATSWHVLANRLPIVGAILESGTANTLSAVTPKDRQSVFDAAAKAAKCTNPRTAIECLRRLPLNKLLEAQHASKLSAFPYVPTIDGRFLSQTPDDVMRLRGFKQIPIMAGMAIDEGTSFTPRSPIYADNSNNSIRKYLRNLVYTSSEDIVDKLVATYSDDPAAGAPYGTGSNLFGQPEGFKKFASVVGDVIMHGPLRALLEQTTAAGVPAYGYQFDGQDRLKKPSRKGVSHGAELSYLFPGEYQLAEHRQLVNRLQTYWINFVNHQDPNMCKSCDQLRNWPPYNFVERPLLNITGAEVMPLIRDDFRHSSLSIIIDHPLLN